MSYNTSSHQGETNVLCCSLKELSYQLLLDASPEFENSATGTLQLEFLESLFLVSESLLHFLNKRRSILISFLFWVFDKEKNNRTLCSLFRREHVQVLSEKTSFIRRDAALNKHNEPPVAAHSLQRQTVKYQPAERKRLHCHSAFNEFRYVVQKSQNQV